MKDAEHQISVVIPVYRGAAHLGALMAELDTLTKPQYTSDGHCFRVVEVVLAHDCGPDDSDRVIRELARQYDWIQAVWLSRNFGQHAATTAGMASTGGEWIATLDEDGQHDPADIGRLLDAAMRAQSVLVYARPVNPAPHPAYRRVSSRLAKRTLTLVGGGADASLFNSYRLVLGEVGRSVAAYVGHGVYLDVALSWVAGKPATGPVTLRDEGMRESGYSTRTLLSHFWRMVLSSGTRALRVVTVLGVAVALLGVLMAAWVAVDRIAGSGVPRGWTSLMVVLLLALGTILFFLGVVAEYVGVAVNMATGRPLYLITTDPAEGPLGRRPARQPDAPGSLTSDDDGRTARP